MHKLFTKIIIIEALMVTLCHSSNTLADELLLPTEPLITAASVQPNMMLLLDSSGSMGNIVVPDDYDPDVDYYDCDSPLDNDDTISIQISSDGDVTFDDGKTFGNSSSTNSNNGRGNKRGNNSTDEGCFDDDLLYDAQLNANGSSGTKNIPGTSYNGGIYYGSASYTGNFLNWYFSDSGSNFGTDAERKPDTETRMEVAKSVATDLIESLEDIRVGIAKFNEALGAKIIANIEDISSAESNLIEQIDTIDFAGATPLGEALSQLGYYFTLGYSATKDLLIHPDDDDKSEYVQTKKVFTESPIYDSTLSAPSEVTENWCQQNFVVAMTDGQPSDSDTNVSSYLENYYNGTGYIVDDVALAMYEIDLRPDLDDDDDEEETNNVTTYVVGFSDESVTSSELLEDTASNGGGYFLSAETSTELVLAFKTATDSIFAKVASQSGVSFNTSSLTSDSAVYSSSFNSSKWSGSLEAYELDDSGDIATDATWDAATQLDEMTYSDRNIFTYNAGGVQFNQASLNSSQLEDLSNGPEGAEGIENLINYISGDRSLEGSGTTDYRTRTTSLGDIVNSTTIYVATPELNWPNWTSENGIGAANDNYSTFVSDNSSRSAMLYVGANDGMLHAFNASLTSTDAGQEAFAYIPGMLYSSEENAGLNYLADKTYAHQFYVDLTPTVSDVYIENAWHTILIGGLRSGGKGIFALDITDPTKFTSSTENAESLALWEFSSSDDSDFGYSFSKPTVAMMANGEWAVILGNGYNNSGDGKAKLFIIFIDQGLDGTWTINNDYIKIDTGIGSTGTPNGLAAPGVVDSDGDGVADRVYAGDLLGNMWAFDISSDDEDDWEVAYSSDNTETPLFSAKDSDGNAQPITSAPIITKNTNSSDEAPNLIVFFGTGKYIEESDKYSTDVMTYYAVLDANEGNKLRADLTLRTLLTDSDKRTISGDNFSWYTSAGWYFDLLDSSETPDELGERVISDSIIINSLLIFTTIIPNVDSGDVCTSNSESWLMAVDLNTGKAPTYAVFDANGDGVIDDEDLTVTEENDANGDGVVDSGDLGYSGIKTSGSMVSEASILSSSVYTNDADGNTGIDLISTGPSEQAGRLSWEEQLR